jgi:hypothetical protein
MIIVKFSIVRISNILLIIVIDNSIYRHLYTKEVELFNSIGGSFNGCIWYRKFLMGSNNFMKRRWETEFISLNTAFLKLAALSTPVFFKHRLQIY